MTDDELRAYDADLRRRIRRNQRLERRLLAEAMERLLAPRKP